MCVIGLTAKVMSVTIKSIFDVGYFIKKGLADSFASPFLLEFGISILEFGIFTAICF